MCSVRVLFVILFLIACPHLAHGEEQKVAGVVEKFCHSDDKLVVERRGASDANFTTLSNIQAGDRIAVANKGGCVWLRMLSDKIIIVENGIEANLIGMYDESKIEKVRGEYIVPESATGISLLADGILDVLFGIVASQVNYERKAVTVAIRGDEPLELPLLWADENYVVEGTRPLAVGWVGGAAPFAVEIGPDGGPPLVAQENVGGQASAPVSADLAPGTWHVSVRDAAGEVVEGTFTVVPAADLPQPPPDEGLEEMPEALRASAYAAWLAEQDEGGWMYEAYLRAGALAGDFAPAGYLERYLASGALWQ